MADLWVTSRSTKPAHTTVYEPVPATKDRTVAPHQPNPKDRPGVAAWRRGGVARAHGARRGQGNLQEPRRNRRVRQCPKPQSGTAAVPRARTGQGQARGALFFALAHTLMRMASLGPEMLAVGKGASAVSGIGACCRVSDCSFRPCRDWQLRRSSKITADRIGMPATAM